MLKAPEPIHIHSSFILANLPLNCTKLQPEGSAERILCWDYSAPSHINY